MAAFEAALDTHKHQAKIARDAEIANKAGIYGTPAFVINGYYLSGAQPVAAFKKLIDLALKGEPFPASDTGDNAYSGDNAYCGDDRRLSLQPATIGREPHPHCISGALRASSSITRSKEEARKRAEEALAKIRKGANSAQIAHDIFGRPGLGSARRRARRVPPQLADQTIRGRGRRAQRQRCIRRSSRRRSAFT